MIGGKINQTLDKLAFAPPVPNLILCLEIRWIEDVPQGSSFRDELEGSITRLVVVEKCIRQQISSAKHSI